jgi:lipopolysaccharide O-acetyltransferase
LRIGATLRWYGVYGAVRLAIDVLITRLMFRPARLVRRPFYVRGRSAMKIGKGFTSGPGLRLDTVAATARLVIGEDVQFNNNVHIAAAESVIIGDRVLIASGVFISDHDHGCYAGHQQSDPRVPPALRALQVAPVVIENDAWLGEHVCVLPGVTIGRGAVVGAGSVVTRDVPEYVVAVGSPARIVKRFDFAQNCWLPER